jgi:hypothetical protein
MIESRLTQILFVAGLSLVGASSSARAQPSMKPFDPCCGITAIDVKHGVVTAKSTSTGTTFNFRFDSGRVPSTLKVGQRVWSRGGKVSLNGADPCCTVVTSTTLGRAIITKLPIGYQASYASDSAAHVGECNQVAQTSFPQGGHTCVPRGAMVSSGKSPDGSDATYSWTCICS